MRGVVAAGVAMLAALALFALPASAGIQPVGDANCDGRVTSLDAVWVLQYDAGLIDEMPCQRQADASFDGTVNSLDAAIILQREARLLSQCERGQTGFKASIRAIEPIMVPGEPFAFTFSVSNCNERETTRRYGSGQIFDVIVYNEEGEAVWNWAFDYGFVLAPMDRTYGDRQTVTYGAVWDQLDNDDILVTPGTYTVEGVDVGCTLPGMTQCNLSATTEIQILVPPTP